MLAGSGGICSGGLMQKWTGACQAATEDTSRAVAGHVARCRWTARATRSVAGIFAARGRRASHESISLIASARHRYVQGWGYDVIPPRSLAMGVVGIVDVCVPLLREKVVCAQRAPRATPPRARRGRGREKGLPRRAARRPSPARPPRRPCGACAASTSPGCSTRRGSCGRCRRRPPGSGPSTPRSAAR